MAATVRVVTAEADAAAELQRLVGDVQNWRAGRRGLLHQPELGLFVRWRQQVPSPVWALRDVQSEEFSLADEYLAASRDDEGRVQREEEAARERELSWERQRAIDAEAATARQRKLTKLAVTAAAIAAVLFVIGIWATWTAILARKHADNSAKEAMAQRMAAQINLAEAQFALGRIRFEGNVFDEGLLWWAKALLRGMPRKLRDPLCHHVGACAGRPVLFTETKWPHAVFSPDGTKICTAEGSGDKDARTAAIRLWDTKTGCLLATLTEQDAGITDVAFTHNGKFLVTGSCDGWLSYGTLAMAKASGNRCGIPPRF